MCSMLLTKTTKTQETIIRSTIPILAREGYAGTSMRKVASSIDREPSIIYAHFAGKKSLLRETRRYINRNLDEAQQYDDALTAGQLLRASLEFQIKQREMIVALLQYFMACPDDFSSVAGGGYVPDRAYQHMARIINKGIAEGVYYSDDVQSDAKASTHLINGYLVEYAQHRMNKSELDSVVSGLASYIERALTCRPAGHR